MYTVFTDGSCNFNKKGASNIGSYAYVILNENGIKIKENVEKVTNTTNNRMELMAVISVLENMRHTTDKIIINTDSEYVSNAINLGWMEKWKKRGFTKGKMKTDIPNKDLWVRLDSLIKPNITFKWCKGHTTTNVWNNYVDALCSSAYNKSFTVVNQ